VSPGNAIHRNGHPLIDYRAQHALYDRTLCRVGCFEHCAKGFAERDVRVTEGSRSVDGKLQVFQREEVIDGGTQDFALVVGQRWLSTAQRRAHALLDLLDDALAKHTAQGQHAVDRRNAVLGVKRFVNHANVYGIRPLVVVRMRQRYISAVI